jgi:hypothetical protein
MAGAMINSLTITLPYLPPKSFSPNARLHWTGKVGDRRSIQDDVRMLIREAGWDGETWLAVKAWVTFHFPSKHRRDPDNFASRMIPVWNALVREGLLADDNVDVIGWPSYSHVYTKPEATIITIERAVGKTHTGRLTK